MRREHCVLGRASRVHNSNIAWAKHSCLTPRAHVAVAHQVEMELEVIECAAGNMPGCTFVVQRAAAHFRQQGCAQIDDSALRLESILSLWERDVADIPHEVGEFSKAVAPATTIDVEHAAGDSR